MTIAANTTRDQFSKAEVSPTGLFWFTDAVWSTVILVVNSISLPVTIITALAQEFGIPLWAVGAFSTMIILALAFAIISAIFKRDT